MSARNCRYVTYHPTLADILIVSFDGGIAHIDLIKGTS
jgi:hypothetical protein